MSNVSKNFTQEKNYEKYITSPINFSKTKQSYTFQKEKRFKPKEINANLNSKTFQYKFHPLPSTNNKRSASIGFGKKYDFIMKHINKQIPFYEIPSEFSIKKPSSPSFSFGISNRFYDKVKKFYNK